MDLVERDKILVEAYKLIEINVMNRNAKFLVSHRIQRKLSFILHNSTIDRRDVIQDLWMYFMIKKYHERFDSTQCKLDTYIKQFLNWRLSVMLRDMSNNEVLVPDLGYIENLSARTKKI